jgi:hypothetical protein
VSRDEREKVLSYKIVSPPTGLYNVKFNVCDPNEKITKLVPNNSSPERDPRFDYNKTNTLLWLPNTRDIESNQIYQFNKHKKCHKCLNKIMDGIIHEHSIEEGGASMEGSVNNSPRRGEGPGETLKGGQSHPYIEGFTNTQETNNINHQDGHPSLTHNLSQFSGGKSPTHHHHQSRLINNYYSG